MENMHRQENTGTRTNQWYFAYGSNMDKEQMADRCPESIFIGKTHLDGYRFLINSRGVATIVPEKGKRVYGIGWRITEMCEARLDGYEGVKFGTYRKQWTNVTMLDGKSVLALIYIARDSQPGDPHAGYLEKIIAAASSHGFEEDYLREIKNWHFFLQEIIRR